MTTRDLQSLQNTSPLPEGWSAPAILEDVVIADGVELRRAGMSSTGPDGQEVNGAAVEAESSPALRSYFELLERVSTMEQLRTLKPSYALRTAEGREAGRNEAIDLFPESQEPTRWRYARSNGIALHAGWKNAAQHAYWELAERDRILRAWYGELAPKTIAFDVGETPLRATQSYEWRACSFPDVHGQTFSRGVDVVGVFGFPTRAAASHVLQAPFVCGYGARPTLQNALDAATREAMQLLAFLWGEPALDRVPTAAPTPMSHLEFFQWPAHHDVARKWLDGAHMSYGVGNRKLTRAASDVVFVDLTPTWLKGGLCVAKAVCIDAMPLAFGDAPFAAHLPKELRVHPIA